MHLSTKLEDNFVDIYGPILWLDASINF